MSKREQLYTVFCRENTGLGTTWIDTIKATSIKNAQHLARKACALDWDFKAKHITTYCVLAGDVTVLHFEDL